MYTIYTFFIPFSSLHLSLVCPSYFPFPSFPLPSLLPFFSSFTPVTLLILHHLPFLFFLPSLFSPFPTSLIPLLSLLLHNIYLSYTTYYLPSLFFSFLPSKTSPDTDSYPNERDLLSPITRLGRRSLTFESRLPTIVLILITRRPVPGSIVVLLDICIKGSLCMFASLRFNKDYILSICPFTEKPTIVQNRYIQIIQER